jgi:uncharacterized NAD(P)/FAD-binding protein YdhS
MDLPVTLSGTDVAGRRLPLAVIGAGFSGTITALNLLRTLEPGQDILLCERAIKFAHGTAYATEHNDHLLNVRAANMSAFAEQPDSFEGWLRGCAMHDTARVRQTPAGVFASRSLYGRYLNAMLDVGMAGVAGSGRLRLVPEEVVDIVPGPGGWRLVFAGGAAQLVAGVVLAIGNLVSARRDTPHQRFDPWAPQALSGLRPGLPVLIVGTGLTTMDVVVALRAKGFDGPVIALSRRGLLPRRHTPAGPWRRPAFTLAERASLLALLRRIRREIAAARAQGVDWRAVIDSMRPDTALLWRGLPERDRARFLRHLRPYWDVHRHRLAPPVADQIDSMLASGYLRVLRGRLRGVEEAADHAVAEIQPRGDAATRLEVQRVIYATGVENAARCNDRLLGSLRARGLVRFDSMGLGVDVTDAFQVIDAQGRASASMWALGPLVRGVFWECTAVPDIRVQVSQLALQVAR